MTMMKTTISALALTAIAGSALAGDFATLDINTDGQVSFTEYSAYAVAEGKTVTLAAQEFTRIAQGDAIVTEDEMLMATAFADQPYVLQNDAFITEPLPYAPVETVEPVETFESFPQSVEAIEPPVMDEPAPEEVPVEETPVEELGEETLDATPIQDPVLEAPEPVTDLPLELETPLEEGVTDLPEPEIEVETETEIEVEEPTLEDGEIY